MDESIDEEEMMDDMIQESPYNRTPHKNQN